MNKYLAFVVITISLVLMNSPAVLGQDCQKITANDLGPPWRNGSHFSWSVSISGNYAVVGAPFDDDHGYHSGSVYVFKLTDNSWTQMAKVTPNDAAPYYNFGITVSISNEYFIAGAHKALNDNGELTGAAYIFKLVDNTWIQMAKLIPAVAKVDDMVGGWVSISDQFAMLDASGYDYEPDKRTGAGFLYERTGESWNEVDIIDTSDVSFLKIWRPRTSGKYVYGLAYRSGYSSYSAPWYIFVFERFAGDWKEVGRFNLNDDPLYGRVFSMSGENLITVGYSDRVNMENVAAYIYSRRDNGLWEETIVPLDLTTSILGSVSIFGDNAVLSLSNYRLFLEKKDNFWEKTLLEGCGPGNYSSDVSDKYAIFGGFHGDPNQPGSAYIFGIGGSSLGACCLPGYQCEQTTEQDCTGTYLGDGTVCHPNPCFCGNGFVEGDEECDDGNNVAGDCCSSTCQFEPQGSPCLDNEFCNGEETCDGEGNCISHGDPCPPGTVCNEETDTCDSTEGACCLSDGSCEQTTLENCTGTFMGVGSDCASADCFGACCMPDEECAETSADNCAGVFKGVGSECPYACIPDGECRCDLNQDGVCDPKDLAILSTQPDLNGDGKHDPVDQQIFADDWVKLHCKFGLCYCELVPDTTVLRRGDTLGFNASIENLTGQTGTISFATKVRRFHSQFEKEFAWGPFRFALNPYQTRYARKTHQVPFDIDEGMYLYTGMVRVDGLGPVARCDFPFQVVDEIKYDPTNLIGPEGGVVEVTDSENPLYGTKIIVPEGALTEPATFTVTESSDFCQLPEGTVGNGPIAEIICSSDAKFIKPVLVELPVDRSPGQDEYLDVYRYDTDTGSCKSITSWYKYNEGKVVLSTEQFSCFRCVRVRVLDFDISTSKHSGFNYLTDSMKYYNETRYCSGVSGFSGWYYNTKGHGLYCYYDTEKGENVANEAQRPCRNVPLNDPHLDNLRNFYLLHEALEEKRTVPFSMYTSTGIGDHDVLVYSWIYTGTPQADGYFACYNSALSRDDHLRYPTRVYAKIENVNGNPVCRFFVENIPEWTTFGIWERDWDKMEGIYNKYSGDHWCNSCDGFPPAEGEINTYRIAGTTETFSTVTEEVAGLVGGYEVIRIWRSDSPPGLGEYGGCDPAVGLIDVATDWWDPNDPSIRGRRFWEPPLFRCQFGATAGSRCEWSGTFGGDQARVVSEVLNYEQVVVPYGTLNNTMKMRVTEYDSSGNISDGPNLVWMDETIGIVKAEHVSGGIIEVIGHTPAPSP